MAYKETILDKIIRLCNGGLNNSSISKKDVLKSILAAISNYSEEPVSEDLEKELSRFLKDCEIDSEYIHQDFLHIVANHFADWQKERIMANSTNATIGLPYENKYGGYTHLIDVSRPLPVGNNKIAIIFKED